MKNTYICPRDKWNPVFYATSKAMNKLVEFFNKKTPQAESKLIDEALQTLVELKEYYLNEPGGPKTYNEIAFAECLFSIRIATYFPREESAIPVFILNVYGDGDIYTMRKRTDLISLQIPLNFM